MATRFYFSAVAHSLNITKRSNWTADQAGLLTPAVTNQSHTTKHNSKYAIELSDDSVYSKLGTTSDCDVRWMSFLTPPLSANFNFTTSHTLSLVIACQEANSTEDAHLAFALRVMQGDTSTERGLLLSSFTTATEFDPSSLHTRIVNAVAFANNVNALAGDRLCLEIGVHGVTPSNTGNVLIHIKDLTANADYALTNDLTTDLSPWWEISANPSFGVSPSVAGDHPAATGTLSETTLHPVSLAGSQPNPTGTLGESSIFPRSVAGSQDAPSATLSEQTLYPRDVAGSQDAPSGDLNIVMSYLASVGGSQDAPNGDLNQSINYMRSVDGDHPSPSGTLDVEITPHQSEYDLAVDGSHDAPSAELLLQLLYLRDVIGDHPCAIGDLNNTFVYARSIEGDHPAPTGLLSVVMHRVNRHATLDVGDHSNTGIAIADRTNNTTTLSDRTSNTATIHDYSGSEA